MYLKNESYFKWQSFIVIFQETVQLFQFAYSVDVEIKLF